MLKVMVIPNRNRELKWTTIRLLRLLPRAEGFMAPSSLPSDSIEGDGSLVLEVYYEKRPTVTISNGSTIGSIKVLDMTKISSSDTPTREYAYGW